MEDKTMIVSIVTLLAFTLGAVISWIVRPTLERLVSSHFDKKFETYRRELETQHESALREATELRNVANTGFSQAQRAIAERRIMAIQTLWRGVLDVKRKRHFAIGLVDTLTERQVDVLEDHGVLDQLASTITVKNVAEPLLPEMEKVEAERPFIGETCYSLYYCYRAISSQAAFVMKEAIENKTPKKWFEDDNIHALLSATMSQAEKQEFEELQLDKMKWYTNLIEQMILTEARRTLSGEEATSESLQQARRIYQAIKLEEEPLVTGTE